MVRLAGVEPATQGLGRPRSIQFELQARTRPSPFMQLAVDFRRDGTRRGRTGDGCAWRFGGLGGLGLLRADHDAQFPDRDRLDLPDAFAGDVEILGCLTQRL